LVVALELGTNGRPERRQHDGAHHGREDQPELARELQAAARVGGILANDRFPADFLRDNREIQTNVIDAAWRVRVKKLCFLGSSCIYPRLATQPIAESELLTGPLEKTNECYAIANIAGIKLCQAYRRQYGFDAISLMPTNLYGPGDNFHPERSCVVPALLRRFHGKGGGVARSRRLRNGNTTLRGSVRSAFGRRPHFARDLSELTAGS
jgi:GDP-L-fucose synthase